MNPGYSCDFGLALMMEVRIVSALEQRRENRNSYPEEKMRFLGEIDLREVALLPKVFAEGVIRG